MKEIEDMTEREQFEVWAAEENKKQLLPWITDPVDYFVYHPWRAWEARAALAAAQDAEDAKRYRWLRRNAIGAFRTNDGKGPVSVYHLCKIPAIPGIPEETDAAIDAAIAAQQGDSHE